MITTDGGEYNCGCKIGRIIEEYGIEDLNKEILEYRNENNMSLRDLCEYINHRVLESAIESASNEILDSEQELFGALKREDAVATIYNVLNDKETPPDRRARVRVRLEQADVDIDSVKESWVTHPTVRRHFQECLGINTSREITINREDANSTIEWIRSRCAAIVGRTLERLKSAEKIRITNSEVSVSLRVTCTECNKTYSPEQLLHRGYCDCYSDIN